MDWKGKRVVILGAARQGTALAAHFARQGAKVLLSDTRPEDQFAAARQQLADYKIEWQFGEPSEQMLKGAKGLFLSGGVSPQLSLVEIAMHRSIPISNDSQAFMELAPCPVVGITGSAGKTTTTILVARMLKAMEGNAFHAVWLGGNIGFPLISSVDQMQATDIAVMELSSFQLELMTSSPHIAALLNLAPNHLDRHRTMADYAAAKARILDFQSDGDVAVLSREDFGSWALRSRVKSTLWSFGLEAPSSPIPGTYVRGKDIWLRDQNGERRLFPLSIIQLRGEHNLLNVLAASAIAAVSGADDKAIRFGVEGFSGAPHRLELVRTVNGVDWFNDSIATSPQRAEASLRSFQRPVVLLLGGRDKGLPWTNLARATKARAKAVVTFGEAASMIGDVLRNESSEVKMDSARDLEEAIALANRLAEDGDVVLLAPGGTSFDEFEDFEARGEHFRGLVNSI
ncbi:MAG: UDP-N-acetylmuramoyl-L-alanine--D-glutamate ligase [Chloroflexi bacterium]|nr:UDP-N-acetylmuramoyl-L-alanine--D-glutamate ligase [Chloroflexota bacterium]